MKVVPDHPVMTGRATEIGFATSVACALHILDAGTLGYVLVMAAG